MNLEPWRAPTEEELRVIDALNERLRDEGIAVAAFPTHVRSLRAPDYWLIEFKEGDVAIQEEVVLDLVAMDSDGSEILLVFATKGCQPWALEFIRVDGLAIRDLPPVSAYRRYY